MNPIAPFVAGFIGDRLGIAKSAAILLLIMMISFADFSITPARGLEPLPLVIFNVAVAALRHLRAAGHLFRRCWTSRGFQEQ